jgi:hypothetical protein
MARSRPRSRLRWLFAEIVTTIIQAAQIAAGRPGAGDVTRDGNWRGY